MLTRKQKEEIVKKLSSSLKSSKASVFVDYKGLNAKEGSDLKKELRESGATFQIVKKTLLMLALKDAKIDLSEKDLIGQIAVSVSAEDEGSAAKILEKFAKSTEHIATLGGTLGERVLTTEEVKVLAKLPSMDGLRGRIVAQLNGPIAGFVNVLNGNMRGLVQALKAVAESKT